MDNKCTIYRTTLISGMTLIVIFICCAAFMGCPEADEMTDGIITLPTDMPPPKDTLPEAQPPPPPEDEPPPLLVDEPPPPPEE